MIQSMYRYATSARSLSVENNMELRHLRYFVALAEALHFGRAAQRLYITQPPLSFSIRQLEEDVGVRLLIRDSKHVSLTPAGIAFLDKAREILMLADRAAVLARSIDSGRVGRLVVGFTGTMLVRGLGQAVLRFARDFPDVELVLSETPSSQQVARIASGHLDAGFLNAQVPPSGLESLVFCEEVFEACLPETHSLSGAESIDLAQLAQESFLVFGREMSDAYYDYIFSLCSDAGFRPRIVQHAGQLSSVVGMVASGMGVALLPRSLRNIGFPGARFIPILGCAPHPSAYLCWHPNRIEPGLPALIGTVRDIVTSGLARTAK